MKKFLWLVVFLFPITLHAQTEGKYPWHLQVFVGGATICDDVVGCFGQSGLTVGGSFGRAMGDRWSFELEGAYVGTTENEPTQFDEVTGIYYTPQLDRTRVWTGGTFLAKMATFGKKNDLHIAFGFVLGYERQTEVAPAGIFVFPPKDIGLKGGVSVGAGFNWWFAEHWAIRPEGRFYLVADSLSGVRYTAGIVREF